LTRRETATYHPAVTCAPAVSPGVPMKAVQRFFRNLFARMGIARELLGFFWRRKLWWMTPLVLVILVVGVLVILGQSSAISAFIYTLF
jgi:hypothetical protein